MMTKCQQYFITDPSRSVDFQRQETELADTSSKQESATPSLRKVAFTSAGTSDDTSVPSDKTVESEKQT